MGSAQTGRQSSTPRGARPGPATTGPVLSLELARKLWRCPWRERHRKQLLPVREGRDMPREWGPAGDGLFVFNGHASLQLPSQLSCEDLVCVTACGILLMQVIMMLTTPYDRPNPPRSTTNKHSRPETRSYGSFSGSLSLSLSLCPPGLSGSLSPSACCCFHGPTRILVQSVCVYYSSTYYKAVREGIYARPGDAGIELVRIGDEPRFLFV